MVQEVKKILILMVVEPAYESLALTGKVFELGQSIGKPVYLLFNKMDAENREWMNANVFKNKKPIRKIPMEKNK